MKQNKNNSVMYMFGTHNLGSSYSCLRYRVFSEGLLKTNSTVLVNGNVCVVVDIPYGAHELCNFVKQNKLKVAAVLLTHGHFDHCGGVKQFFESCGGSAPVFVHQNDVELCKTASENIWHLPAENCFPTNIVTEGKLCVAGLEFSVLETPGHTAGSVVYLVENLMLSGDTLMKNSIGRTDFCESVPSKMYQSLQKLRNLQQNYTMVCGHGETTNLNYEKQHNDYLRQANSGDNFT